MAPLDTGTLSTHLRVVDPSGRTVGPAPEDYDTLGAYLRAVREHRGVSLADLAASTRIRRAHLQAIEERNRSALPSRPFAIGYVRSYAKALGVDGEGAVQRFKSDWPETDEPLRNPVGVQGEARKRNPAVTVAVVVLLAGVAVWNVVQRTLVNDEPAAPPLAASLAATPTPPATGVMHVAAPTEAPVESTTPPPYLTPGLFPAATAAGAPPAATAAAPPSAALGLAPPAPVFATRLPISGADKGGLLLQGRRSVALIVRDTGRNIVFARVLQPGEAFRAPLGRSLTAEVADPASVAVYQNGRLHGLLTELSTPLDGLAPAATAPALPAAVPIAAPAAATAPPPTPVAAGAQPANR